MGTRTSLNLVLLAVVAALAWLALRPGAEAPAPGQAVTALAPQDIERIRIDAAGRPAVTLERGGDAWRVTSPLDAPADGFRVAALLGLATARSTTGFRADGNDLAQYGLEPGLAVVVFDDTAVLVGDTDPVAGQRYVLSDGQVHLLDDRWFAHVFGQPEAWVDPSPLAGRGVITGIALPAARWRLEDGRWRRTPPDPDLSGDAGPALADAWARARALSVRALDPALPWSERVTIATHDGAPLVLELARVGDALVLGRTDLKVQYRFLARQGDVLLGRSAP